MLYLMLDKVAKRFCFVVQEKNKCWMLDSFDRGLSQLDDDKQTEITTYALEQLYKSKSSKGSKYSGSSSRISNNSKA